MGFSLKKAVKSVSKAVKKVSKSVTKPVESSLKNISKGNIGGAVGDLTSGAARMGLDVATGGNKNLVDSFSGGLLSSVESAARGNSKDIVRVGATGGATFFGGPAAGFAVNNVLSQGGNIAQAAMAAGSGGEMNILSDVTGFLSSGNPLAQLANNAISNLTSSPKSAPKVSSAPAVQTISVPSQSGMSTGMMMGIGAAVVGLVLVFVLVFKRK